MRGWREKTRKVQLVTKGNSPYLGNFIKCLGHLWTELEYGILITQRILILFDIHNLIGIICWTKCLIPCGNYMMNAWWILLDNHDPESDRVSEFGLWQFSFRRLIDQALSREICRSLQMKAELSMDRLGPDSMGPCMDSKKISRSEWLDPNAGGSKIDTGPWSKPAQ